MTDVEGEDDAGGLTRAGNRVGSHWSLDLHIFLRGTQLFVGDRQPRKRPKFKEISKRQISPILYDTPGGPHETPDKCTDIVNSTTADIPASLFCAAPPDYVLCPHVLLKGLHGDPKPR
jgi:hypothetical protein